MKISRFTVHFLMLFSEAGTNITIIYDDGVIELGPEMLHPRFGAGALQVSPNEILVFNGYHAGDNRNQAEIYDLSTEQWTDLGQTTPGKSAYPSGVMFLDETGENVGIISGKWLWFSAIYQFGNIKITFII